MSESSKRRGDNPPLATLDEVLEAYAMSDGGPSLIALADWVRRYPEFEEELTSLTAYWGLATHLPDVQDPDEPDEETLVLRGMSVVQSLLHGQSGPSPVAPGRHMPTTSGADLGTLPDSHVPPTRPTRAEVPLLRSTPIRGLLIEGARHGLTPNALAGETGLSVPLLRKLDRRVIPADTIPRSVSERLAGVLRCDLSIILDYSRLKPRFALGAEHRASQAPTLPAKLEAFFDAVRGDPELSEEQRAALLALEAPGPPPGGGEEGT
jgi:hypothetical protein